MDRTPRRNQLGLLLNEQFKSQRDNYNNILPVFRTLVKVFREYSRLSQLILDVNKLIKNL